MVAVPVGAVVVVHEEAVIDQNHPARARELLGQRPAFREHLLRQTGEAGHPGRRGCLPAFRFRRLEQELGDLVAGNRTRARHLKYLAVEAHSLHIFDGVALKQREVFVDRHVGAPRAHQQRRQEP